MISSVIQKEFLKVDSVINIAWTPCESVVFESFIKETCRPCNIISLTETYYGMNDISIVVCNNRLTHLDQSIEIAKFFFCPLLVIDHNNKSHMVADDIKNDIPIEPVYQIATSNSIFTSWGKIQNSVLEYDIQKPQSKNTWKNLIFQLCKSNMVVRDEQIKEN